MRMRIKMLIKDTKFNGMIEMDESYFSGKERKKDKREDNDPNLSTTTLKRGRGTNKVLVAGMVHRKGMVKTILIDKLTKRNLLYMLKTYAKQEIYMLFTDGFSSYTKLDNYIDRLEINHKKALNKDIVHANTIEGF